MRAFMSSGPMQKKPRPTPAHPRVPGGVVYGAYGEGGEEGGEEEEEDDTMKKLEWLRRNMDFERDGGGGGEVEERQEEEKTVTYDAILRAKPKNYKDVNSSINALGGIIYGDADVRLSNLSVWIGNNYTAISTLERDRALRESEKFLQGIDPNEEDVNVKTRTTTQLYDIIKSALTQVVVEGPFSVPDVLKDLKKTIRTLREENGVSSKIIAEKLFLQKIGTVGARLVETVKDKDKALYVVNKNSHDILNAEVDVTKAAAFYIRPYLLSTLNPHYPEIITRYKTEAPTESTGIIKLTEEDLWVYADVKKVVEYRNILTAPPPYTVTFFKYYKLLMENANYISNLSLLSLPIIEHCHRHADTTLKEHENAIKAVKAYIEYNKTSSYAERVLLFADQVDAGLTLWGQYIEAIDKSGLFPNYGSIWKNPEQGVLYGENIDDKVRDATTEYEATLSNFRFQFNIWTDTLVAAIGSQQDIANYISSITGVSAESDNAKKLIRIKSYINNIILAPVERVIQIAQATQVASLDLKQCKIENNRLLRENTRLKATSKATPPQPTVPQTTPGGPVGLMGAAGGGGGGGLYPKEVLIRDKVFMSSVSYWVNYSLSENPFMGFVTLFAGNIMTTTLSALLQFDPNDILTEMIVREVAATEGVVDKDMKYNEEALKGIAEVCMKRLEPKLSDPGILKPPIQAAKACTMSMVLFMLRREGGITDAALFKTQQLRSAFANFTARHYARESSIQKKTAASHYDKITLSTALAEADILMRSALRESGYTTVAPTAALD